MISSKKGERSAILTMTVIVLLLMSPIFLFVQPFSESDASLSGKWTDEGNYNTDWYTSNPDASEFEIGTNAELAGLAFIVNTGIGGKRCFFSNKMIRLTNDVDLSRHEWVPIGDTVNVSLFEGSFDGGGYKISNVTINSYNSVRLLDINYTVAGLFGWIDTSVSDVAVSDVSLSNIDVDVNIQIIGTSQVDSSWPSFFVGGIVGYLCSYYTNVTINDCSVQGTISVSGRDIFIGGIVGQYEQYHAASTFEIFNCNSDVDIIGNNIAGESSPVKAGGFIGSVGSSLFGGTTYATVKIENCFNTGNVTAVSSTGEALAGGIVGGIVSKADTPHSIISNCYNVGVISGSDSEYKYLGQIVGTTSWSKTTEIFDSYGNGTPISYGNYTSTRVGTFDSPDGVLTSINGDELLSGTLVDALNEWVSRNDPDSEKYSVWVKSPYFNGGYPVFRIVDYTYNVAPTFKNGTMLDRILTDPSEYTLIAGVYSVRYGVDFVFTVKADSNHDIRIATIDSKTSGVSVVGKTIICTSMQSGSYVFGVGGAMRNIHAVTFDANGGTGTMTDQMFAQGVLQTLMPNEFTKYGSAFDRWNTEFDGSGTSYEDGQLMAINSSIVLYAQWNTVYPAAPGSSGDSAIPVCVVYIVLAVLTVSMICVLGFALFGLERRP